ncbi:MAG: hypothetical protein HOO06_15040 [Bdellovibrionaceae bacterium]|jgi:hypothetical protein|nr:hypothetical protein [Pseudobdellovibrionaceae bacterium]
MKYLFLVMIQLLVISANSEELDNQAMVVKKFRAVVQYVSGEAFVKTGDVIKAINFRDIISEDSIITTSPSGYIKLITEKRCVAVLYNGQLSIHKTEEDQVEWVLDKGSLRWICKAKSGEVIKLAGQYVQVGNFGEFLFANNKLVVTTDSVLSFGLTKDKKNKLAPLKGYEFNDNSWEISADLDDKSEVTAFLSKLKLPKESFKFKKSKSKMTSRWVMGPQLGKGNMIHNNKLVEMESVDFNDGFKAQVNFLWGGRSVIASLNYKDGTLPGADPGGGSSSDQNFNEANRLRVDMEWADVGLRLSDHQRDWSFFWKVGIGSAQHDMHPPYGDTNYSENLFVEYTMLSAIVGVDKEFTFSFSDKLGIYVSAELQLIETVSGSGSMTNHESSIFPEELKQFDGGFTSIGLNLFLGPVLRF